MATPPPGFVATDALVAWLDPATGAIAGPWTARPAAGRDWLVYQGAVAPDERAVYLSYHGATTTGIDRFDLVPTGLRRCPPAADPAFGCIAAHGGFAFYRDRLLVATGTPVIVATDPSGAARGAYDTGLAGNHLMEFTVDANADRLYAVGPCGYAGGFAAVDLRRPGSQASPAPPVVAVTQTPSAPDQPFPCGERPALGPGPVLVVTQAITGALALDLPGRLLVLDPATGGELRRTDTPSTPIDVVVA